MHTTIKNLFLLTLLGTLFFTACELDVINDPNNPSLGSVSTDASKPELQVLVTGLEARHRVYYENATEMFGCFGREVWAFFGSDPRFVDQWQAVGISETYPDFFASAGTYVSPYLAVKQANVLIAAAQGSSSLTPAEVDGYTGFAKTIKAYQLLWPLLQQGSNGIRIDVEEPLNPGPVLSFDQALAEIRALLEEAAADLDGAEFAFSVTAGFEDFATPEAMLQFNRAVAAKAAMYAEEWRDMEEALEASYLNLDATTVEELNVGPLHTYGNAPDINNPLFYPYDRATNTILIVHPAMVEDALPGDGRLSKFAERVDNIVTTATADGTTLTGRYQDARWNGPTDPIPYLRNEELILMYAEANAQIGDTDAAVDAINTVRNIWGVGDYTGATDTDALVEEILFQRRYSLWAEAGQRWVDLRRYDRLNADNIDLRDGGGIFTEVAPRVSEIAWGN
jgi:hypothetical protein